MIIDLADKMHNNKNQWLESVCYFFLIHAKDYKRIFMNFIKIVLSEVQYEIFFSFPAV